MSVRNELLSELESNRGSVISGQQLADRLNVSRNAIWKAAKQLEREGYQIEAGQNRGYRLQELSSIVSEEGIRVKLSDKNKKLKILVYQEIDSTNNEAKRQVAAGLSEPVLIFAEMQTAGRGRQGKSFFSPSGTGIYMTLILQPRVKLENSVTVTTAAAVAVSRAIERITGRNVGIKWVNDIYINGKKLVGILTEAVTDFETGILENVIIGIGINVSTKEFPPELEQTATSIASSGINRNELIAAVCDEIIKITSDLSDFSYLADYRSHSIVLGRDIYYIEEGKIHQAKAIDVDETGGLIVEYEINGNKAKKVLRSGEISVRFR